MVVAVYLSIRQEGDRRADPETHPTAPRQLPISTTGRDG
ncbi:hypothetical protein AB395_0000965 [Sinorhizobium fredii CCBAU 45436]|nr:hypothetical protein AB395_0000965 [Sinorhizobium fredii CCBAU 45436]